MSDPIRSERPTKSDGTAHGIVDVERMNVRELLRYFALDSHEADLEEVFLALYREEPPRAA